MSKGLGALIVVLAMALSGEGTWARQSATPAQALRFDAASVKPSAKNSQYGNSSLWQFMPNGDVRFENATLRLIIALAYQNDIRFNDILLLGPQPILEERFDILAKGPAGNTQARQQRLQALLEERFKIRTHTEIRDVPIYALTLVRPGRLGRNLREAKVNCTDWDDDDKGLVETCGASIRRDAVKARLRESGPMALLAQRLHRNFTDRPLEDQTGLSGLFEWDMTFSVDRNPAADSEFPSLETALADELGLKLEPRRAPREVRIIDNAEAPTEN